MSSTESVTLSLSTLSISTLATTTPFFRTNVITNNEYGYSNVNCTDFRIDNINLKSLLGQMSDKYTKFNIQLVNIINGSGMTPANQNFLNVKISGLNFINGSYDIIPSNCGWVSAGFINLNSGTNNYGLTSFYQPVCNTFLFSSENVSLYIRLNDAITSKLPAVGYNAYFCFLFQITPVE